MSPEKESILLNRYPLLFRNNRNPNANSLIDGGFACGDGWFNIINDLCKTIHDAFANSGLPESECPIVAQVKEKFGGLRYYTEAVNPAISNIVYSSISEYERISETICEFCGNPGKLKTKTNGSWIRTVCEKEDW